jgi:hypothetical protein
MLTIYLLGVVVTAVGAYVQSRSLRDDRGPAPTKAFLVAALAGLLWPVVVLGVVQFGLVVAVQRIARRSGSLIPA